MRARGGVPMKVHLHTICWNDRPMLDFFFRHYSPLVSRFFIHDDGSDDGSLEYLARRDDVSVEPLIRTDANSFVLSAKHIYDTSWKRSADADWVIVTNLDEHLHHPDMAHYLERCARDGATIIPSLGYQMITQRFPAPDSVLWRDCVMGAPYAMMSKLQMFNPRAVQETNFSPGRHFASFKGDIRFPETDDVANLHYKYLGVAETYARHTAQAQRLGSIDIEKKWGKRYQWTQERLGKDFEAYIAQLVDITGRDHNAAHTEPRWWRKAG